MAKKVTHYFEIDEAKNAEVMKAFGYVLGKDKGQTNEDVFKEAVKKFIKKMIKRAQIEKAISQIKDIEID